MFNSSQIGKLFLLQFLYFHKLDSQMPKGGDGKSNEITQD